MVSCAVCKCRRRKCAPDCIFSPYFPPDDPQRFACVQRLFGVSNTAKVLRQAPLDVRAHAAESLCFEARRRFQDPIYGCAGIVYQLQQEIRSTEIELAKILIQIGMRKFQIPSPVAESDIDGCARIIIQLYKQVLMQIEKM